MIQRMISHNGRLQPVEEARLSPGQEGLIQGWGLFSTLRVFDGRAFAFERHWRRLRRDAERTHVPFPFDERKVLAQLGEVVRANQAKEGVIRIYMVWNRTSQWHSEEAFPDVDLIITLSPLPKYPEVMRLDLREHGRYAASPLAGVKTISWLNNVWHLSEAKKRGFDEVVLLNERGEVAECTSANVFCVRGGEVSTPPLNSGCLAGITREVMIEIAPRAGIQIHETTLRPEDLYSADEVFLSSTNRAPIAVGEIAGHKFPSAPGAFTGKLGDLFAAYVVEYFAGTARTARVETSA